MKNVMENPILKGLICFAFPFKSLVSRLVSYLKSH